MTYIWKCMSNVLQPLMSLLMSFISRGEIFQPVLFKGEPKAEITSCNCWQLAQITSQT